MGYWSTRFSPKKVFNDRSELLVLIGLYFVINLTSLSLVSVHYSNLLNPFLNQPFVQYLCGH